MPKAWSGTEWASLAHNSLATLGPLKLQAYHLSSPLFLTAKGLKGAPNRGCLGTMTWIHTVTLVHYQVEGKGHGSLTASCRSHSVGVVVFFAFAATPLPPPIAFPTCLGNKHIRHLVCYIEVMCHPTA